MKFIECGYCHEDRNQIIANNSDIKPYTIKPMYDEYYIDYTGVEAKITLIDNYNHKILLTQLHYSLITGFEFAMKKFEVKKIDEETVQNKVNEIYKSDEWEIKDERLNKGVKNE